MAQSNDQSMDMLDDDYSDEQSGSEMQFDIQHYLRTLRKHKWLIMLFTALVTAAAAYYAHTATPIYRSTSTLLIESDSSGPLSIEGWVGVDTQAADYYQTQFELLKSRELAARVVRHMDLVNHPDFLSSAEKARLGITSESANSGEAQNQTSSEDGILGKISSTVKQVSSAFTPNTGSDTLQQTVTAPIDRAADGSSSVQTDQLANATQNGGGALTAEQQRENNAVSTFLNRLTVVPVRNTKLVKISFESPDRHFAAEVANTLGEQYIFAGLDAKLEQSSKVSAWTNEQLSKLKQTLDESEAKVLAFKQDNGLIDVNGSVQRLNEQEMGIYTQELASARSQLSDASDLRNEIRSYNGDVRLLESVPAVQNDALVRDAKLDIGQAQRELDELLNRYGARHPRVVDATSRLESLQASMSANVSRVVDAIESDYVLLQQRVASIQSQLTRGRSDIQALSAKSFELGDLEREVDSNRSIYQQFLTRITEANSTDGFETANAQIADVAVPAANAFKPKKQLIVALAALGALVLSMLMALLYEQMDGTVKGTRDVEKRLRSTLLGIAPLVKKGILGKKSTVPLNPVNISADDNSYLESINTIRTALVMGERSQDEGCQVVVVTSSVPGEGKSTTSLSLAYAFSKVEKVLLIDADLRRPSIAKALDFEKSTPGLSTLITNTGSARECLIRGAVEKLDVILSGPAPDRPLELLSSPRFERLIEQLKGHYDRIIIDCAPAQAVSDPLVLSKLANSVIYCVKGSSTQMEVVERGLERLKQVRANVVGVVMTQVDMKKLTQYGGDHYYQGYYDYYGYTDKEAGVGGKLTVSQHELDEMNSRDHHEVQYEFGLGSVDRYSDDDLAETLMADDFDETLDFGHISRLDVRRESV